MIPCANSVKPSNESRAMKAKVMPTNHYDTEENVRHILRQELISLGVRSVRTGLALTGRSARIGMRSLYERIIDFPIRFKTRESMARPKS